MSACLTVVGREGNSATLGHRCVVSCWLGNRVVTAFTVRRHFRPASRPVRRADIIIKMLFLSARLARVVFVAESIKCDGSMTCLATRGDSRGVHKAGAGCVTNALVPVIRGSSGSCR